jgi:hypothetical protein
MVFLFTCDKSFIFASS